MTLRSGKTRGHALRQSPLALAMMGACAVATATPATQLDQLLEMRLEDLMAVKVSAVSKTAESALAAPAPVTVVTADDIRSFGWRTLGDALKTMPGLQVSYDRGYQYLGVRGINNHDYNSRMLLLIDGRRSNESVYDQAFIESAFMLDMEAIERIEVVSGPGSSLYGNNAMLGVVNVVTRKGASMQGGRAVAEVSSQRGKRLYMEKGNTTEDGTQYSISGSVAQSRGADLYFPEQATNNMGVAQALDGELTRKLFAQYSSGGWQLQAGYVERRKQDPTALYQSVFSDPLAGFSEGVVFASVTRKMMLSSQTEGLFQISRNAYHYENQYRYAKANPDPVNRDHTHGDWWQAEARLTHTGWARHRLTAGVELQRNGKQNYDNYDVQPGYTFWLQRGSSSKAALFVDDLYSINERWQLDAGVRVDHFRTGAVITVCDPANVPECTTSHFNSGGTKSSPRVALIYRPVETTAIKLMGGRAFRAPNPGEMGYITTTGTAMLGRAGPERFDSRELSAEHFVHANFKLWANAFRYVLRGVIARDASYTYVNQGDIASSGLVLGAEWKDTHGRSLRGSLSHSRARDVATGARLSDAPVNLVRVNYAFNVPQTRWRAGAELQSHSSRLDGGGRRISGASLLNLTLSSSRLFAQADVTVSIHNLLGRKYADPAASAEQAPITQIAQDTRSLRVQTEWRF